MKEILVEFKPLLETLKSLFEIVSLTFIIYLNFKLISKKRMILALPKI
jgi:hypothetical protein